MFENGPHNMNYGVEAFGFRDLATVHWNMIDPVLYEHAIAKGEASITAGGALCAQTGKHTGRSPKDKFIVCDDRTRDNVWWENNGKLTQTQFALLHDDFVKHARGKQLYVQDLYAGADPAHRLPTRVYTELAWQSLFIRNLLIRPARDQLSFFVPRFTIACFPSFKADPARHGVRSETVIAIDFTRQIVLIGGTSYAGEIKKSVFTILNYLLPRAEVMPMHCSANVGTGGDSAIFFGLSGTGKTTLSADPGRVLVGDDEHGWGSEGIFNFEGGCYAKAIKLSAEAEPQIYAATQRFGTVLENVVVDSTTRECNFDDGSLTENTRAAYPLHFIANASATGTAPHPRNVVMLTADAFGVMPPIARLSPEQAMYHFLSGYTAKVAGTEKGVTKPEATFSTCFGAPFMPRPPAVYGNLLRKLIAQHQVDCWLINTGWTGGIYGTGQRMPIKATRALLTAALDGSLRNAEFDRDPYFGFEVPKSAGGVDQRLLNPRATWANPAEYDRVALRLVEMFQGNFARFASLVDESVRNAGPSSTAPSARVAASR